MCMLCSVWGCMHVSAGAHRVLPSPGAVDIRGCESPPVSIQNPIQSLRRRMFLNHGALSLARVFKEHIATYHFIF